MSQRWIEWVVGRLLTDEEFREQFAAEPQRVLAELLQHGALLTPTEISALTAIDPTLWKRVAEEIDPRLQKASLKSE